MDLNGIGKVGDRVSEGQTAGVHGTGFATGSLTVLITRHVLKGARW